MGAVAAELGLGSTTDLPGPEVTGSSSTPYYATATSAADTTYPGNAHCLRAVLEPPGQHQVDMYQFTLQQSGTVSVGPWPSG